MDLISPQDMDSNNFELKERISTSKTFEIVNNEMACGPPAEETNANVEQNSPLRNDLVICTDAKKENSKPHHNSTQSNGETTSLSSPLDGTGKAIGRCCFCQGKRDG